MVSTDSCGHLSWRLYASQKRCLDQDSLPQAHRATNLCMPASAISSSRAACLSAFAPKQRTLSAAKACIWLQGNRKYVKCLYVYNKIDVCSIEEVDAIAR